MKYREGGICWQNVYGEVGRGIMQRHQRVTIHNKRIESSAPLYPPTRTLRSSTDARATANASFVFFLLEARPTALMLPISPV
jgi:hypothetical protein